VLSVATALNLSNDVQSDQLQNDLMLADQNSNKRRLAI
jgi:hypothetical protein